jgi:uncharacterized protein
VINLKRAFILLVFLLILIAGGAFSYASVFELPEQSQEFYVYDEVGIIDSDFKSEIVGANQELRESTGAQVVVAIVDNTEGSGDLKDYANRLFEKWQIGDSEKDNGVLMLISMEERKIWIEIGYGLEGILPDGRVGEIIRDDITPYFKEEIYDYGIEKGFYSIVGEISEEYGITNTYLENYYYEEVLEDESSELDSEQEEEKESNRDTVIWVIVIGLGIVVLAWLRVEYGPPMFTGDGGDNDFGGDSDGGDSGGGGS